MRIAHIGSSPVIAVIGGGFSGTVFALKLARAQPDTRVVLIERDRRAGRGLAYGACTPFHLLNVPVERMELGLTPSFAAWLGRRSDRLGEALLESADNLASAFVPRDLFGTYLEERLGKAISIEPGRGLGVLRGEAVRLLDFPSRGVQLSDGREIHADVVVLATGNLPPRPPPGSNSWLYETALFVPDPWARDAFDGLDPEAPVVLLGTGLTMVDVALKLAGDGHTGVLQAVSRRGYLPLAHRAGGNWPAFFDPKRPQSPLELLRLLRARAKTAAGRDVPWQRVMDAMRPAVAGVWAGWSRTEQAQFLRHARPHWDVHRHRMAPRVAEKIRSLIDRGQLRILAGRVRDYRRSQSLADVVLAERGTRTERVLTAARVVNCTGPRSDMDRLAIPIFADLRRRGLISPDRLGLGIETKDCAAVASSGHVSSWLYALGPLTRPAWWEVVAVPEINAQIDRLVGQLTQSQGQASISVDSLAEAFADLGAGI